MDLDETTGLPAPLAPAPHQHGLPRRPDGRGFGALAPGPGDVLTQGRALGTRVQVGPLWVLLGGLLEAHPHASAQQCPGGRDARGLTLRHPPVTSAAPPASHGCPTAPPPPSPLELGPAEARGAGTGFSGAVGGAWAWPGRPVGRTSGPVPPPHHRKQGRQEPPLWPRGPRPRVAGDTGPAAHQMRLTPGQTPRAPGMHFPASCS